MKKFIFTLSLAALLAAFPSCSDDNTRPAQIIVTVADECVCNIFLYTPDGICLKSKIWDCQETKHLLFNVYYEGVLIIKAEIKDKSVSQSITTQYGHTYEVGLIF